LEGTEKLKTMPVFVAVENVEAFTDDIQAFSWGRMLEPVMRMMIESGNRRRKHRSLESESGNMDFKKEATKIEKIFREEK